MSKILLAKQVITDQEKLQIAQAELIGISKMEQVLDIVIRSLKSNDATKYKAFIEAMEQSNDLTLQNKAKELGKWAKLTTTCTNIRLPLNNILFYNDNKVVMYIYVCMYTYVLITYETVRISSVVNSSVLKWIFKIWSLCAYDYNFGAEINLQIRFVC